MPRKVVPKQPAPKSPPPRTAEQLLADKSEKIIAGLNKTIAGLNKTIAGLKVQIAELEHRIKVQTREREQETQAWQIFKKETDQKLDQARQTLASREAEIKTRDVEKQREAESWGRGIAHRDQGIKALEYKIAQLESDKLILSENLGASNHRQVQWATKAKEHEKSLEQANTRITGMIKQIADLKNGLLDPDRASPPVDEPPADEPPADNDDPGSHDLELANACIDYLIARLANRS